MFLQKKLPQGRGRVGPFGGKTKKEKARVPAMGKGEIADPLAEGGEGEGKDEAKAKKAQQAKMLKKATGGRGVAFTAAKDKGKEDADDDEDDSEDGDFEAGLIEPLCARTPRGDARCSTCRYYSRACDANWWGQMRSCA